MSGSKADSRKERLDRGIKVRSDGVYAISSWREITYLITPRLLFIVGLALAPLLLSGAPYWQRVISIVCSYSLLAIGFDFLANYVGLVSLGGGFYVGVGAYVAALLNTSLGVPPFLSIPIAAILGGVICTVLVCAVPASQRCLFRNSQSDVSTARSQNHRSFRSFRRN